MQPNEILFTARGLVPVPLPERATPGSAAFDLFAALRVPLDINRGTCVKISCGFAIAMPPHMCMLILPRSGLATKHGLVQGGSGLVDSDYRGEVLIALRNLSNNQYTVQPHERIAQALFLPVLSPTFTVVKSLPDSERGEGGHGSTGSF